MVVLVLVVCFLRRLAVDGSHLARLLIASAREFIADAEAVRLTHNPAALVWRSAISRDVSYSRPCGRAGRNDDPRCPRRRLRHAPTIAERVAAIIAVTGSMALIAPARRDTRPPAPARRHVRPPPGACARSRLAIPCPAGSGTEFSARATAAEGFNRLGLTREMTVGAVAVCGAFFWMHGATLGNPLALAAAFDPEPLRSSLKRAARP